MVEAICDDDVTRAVRGDAGGIVEAAGEGRAARAPAGGRVVANPVDMSILRTRPLPLSATYILPPASASPKGMLNIAACRGPASPPKPACPTPANVEIVPALVRSGFGVNIRTTPLKASVQ
jgi:hypothetical protein